MAQKIDSIYDFSDKALVELKSWLEPWFLTRCPCGNQAAVESFPVVISELATTRDLRGYWRLGDGASPFADTSGYGGGPSDLATNVGTGGSTPIDEDVSPGLISAADDDGAVRLNEEGDDIGLAVPTRPELEGNSADVGNFDFGSGHPAMSVTAWVKPGSSGNSFWGSVVSLNSDMGSGGTAFTGGWALQVSFPDGKVEFWRNASFGSHVVATSPAATVGTTQSYFIVATYDNTTIRVYSNGVLVAFQADATDVPTIAAPHALEVGGHRYRYGPASQNWQPFFGVIDEVSVWGDVLSASEISRLYTAGVG